MLAALLSVACCTGACVTPLCAQEGAPVQVVPDAELEIGRASGERTYLFQSVRSAHFLPDGRIVVADGGHDVLRVYGPDGDIRTELGGRGEGPGEFRNIMGTWLTPGRRIAVWDAGNRRITTFGLDGEMRSAERVTAGRTARGNLEVFFGAFADGDAVLGTLSYGGPGKGRTVTPDACALGRFGIDGRRRDELGELRGMRRAGRDPIPFSPMPLVAVARDSIYTSDGYDAAISVRDGTGRVVRTIELRRRVMSADGVWSSLEAELRRLSSGSPVARLFLRNLESGRVPRGETFPQLADLLVDDRGYLWVKMFEPPDDSIWLRKKGASWPSPGGVWRVVQPDGDRVAEVDMPDDVRPLEIRGDRLLGLATDELGVERVVVHRIEGRPSP